MGTRCVTIVMERRISHDGNTVDELFRFYRHFDGYPEGHGLDMALALLKAEAKSTEKIPGAGYGDQKLNNRNWCQHAFAEIFAMDADLEVEPDGYEHGDIEYLYVVNGLTDVSGGKEPIPAMDVNIAVHKVGWDDKYGDVLRRDPMFKGTPSEYVKWIEDGEE